MAKAMNTSTTPKDWLKNMVGDYGVRGHRPVQFRNHPASTYYQARLAGYSQHIALLPNKSDQWMVRLSLSEREPRVR